MLIDGKDIFHPLSSPLVLTSSSSPSPLPLSLSLALSCSSFCRQHVEPSPWQRGEVTCAVDRQAAEGGMGGI